MTLFRIVMVADLRTVTCNGEPIRWMDLVATV